ncbi:non-hydrolyzing UDP-N-acetylglucosamine 2-epimerase [Exiguobacterium flavidum]|uniref:non-hydrolyzing UDP-N-acetylglucosamine 2-epimerase n=1 Tax=Exiguobacterium flavidum TaxID=2184695 RepID=UPI000DF778F6|nr:UDP-N-acetylglucosamine 2-epimerase (non-hydrolyzing) [Exiguobacterium flavidum]
MKKVMLVFGTRPEAIKMAPLCEALKKREGVKPVVVVTAQHREMLDQVLDLFQIVPDHDLDLMAPRQTLEELTARILSGMKAVLETEKPDLVLVHGDTTTTFATSLAAFYQQIPIGHVEAGLRTYEKYSPFPEEMNRQLTGVLADIHFAPTEQAAENLRREGKVTNVHVTGNTVIDALKTTVKDSYVHPVLERIGERRLVLLTVHRRENHERLSVIFDAIIRLHAAHPDIEIVFPVHPNPVVLEASRKLEGIERIHLIEPLDVFDFHNFAARSTLILTDSGGIQEEAPSLGVPVLVLRDTTERGEGVAAGTLRLVGTNPRSIFESGDELLSDPAACAKMAQASNPYGDGHASERIVDAIMLEEVTV